jgi:DMSO/TMAO reductase YedYZ molybdopterin-dependent catalytic subunit
MTTQTDTRLAKHGTGGVADAASDVSSSLLVLREDPFNAETRLAEHGEIITPTAAFYVRNHFSVPNIDFSQWRLRLDGEVGRAQVWRYEELLALPSRTLLVTLECAGNGRSAMSPRPQGEPWQYGAVSTAEWTGVSLADLLSQSELSESAVEVIAEGADSGFVADKCVTVSFSRSLPLAQALHPDTLLAYAMNGKALTPEHGFPLRLIVPGWYGVASVKWLMHLTVVSEPFRGFYQAERYIMMHEQAPTMTETGALAGEPLTKIVIRSLLISPASGTILPRGEHCMRGLAWSGAAPVTRVEVSTNGGVCWNEAELVSEPTPYAWRQWEYRWMADRPGSTQLCSRASDADGNSQPAEAPWNPLGYANNAIQRVEVEIR